MTTNVVNMLGLSPDELRWFRAGCDEEIAAEIRPPGQPDFNLDYGREQIIAALKERMGADYAAKLVRFGWYDNWVDETKWVARVTEHKDPDQARVIRERLTIDDPPGLALEWFFVTLQEWLGPDVSLRMARAFILLSPTFEELVKLNDDEEDD